MLRIVVEPPGATHLGAPPVDTVHASVGGRCALDALLLLERWFAAHRGEMEKHVQFELCVAHPLLLDDFDGMPWTTVGILLEDVLDKLLEYREFVRTTVPGGLLPAELPEGRWVLAARTRGSGERPIVLQNFHRYGIVLRNFWELRKLELCNAPGEFAEFRIYGPGCGTTPEDDADPFCGQRDFEQLGQPTRGWEDL